MPSVFCALTTLSHSPPCSSSFSPSPPSTDLLPSPAFSHHLSASSSDCATPYPCYNKVLKTLLRRRWNTSWLNNCGFWVTGYWGWRRAKGLIISGSHQPREVCMCNQIDVVTHLVECPANVVLSSSTNRVSRLCCLQHVLKTSLLKT